MTWYIAVSLVLGVICVIIVSIVVIGALFLAIRAKEEKGPMPKNHGGFGQRVTGGKS